MKFFKKKTIKRPFSFRGVGLHSGETSSVKVLPAEANSGINFVRVDLKKDNLIAANFRNVTSTQLCTVLKKQERRACFNSRAPNGSSLYKRCR